MKQFITLLAIFALAVSCKSVGSNSKLGGASEDNTEGWLDDDTYVMVVVGQWNRDQYYIEGEEAQDGKKAKSLLGLQADSKTAAKNLAMRNFSEKMKVEVKGKTGVEDGILIADVVQSGIDSTVIAPSAGKERYTERGDARITYTFHAKGLKKVVDKMAADVLKKRENP